MRHRIKRIKSAAILLLALAAALVASTAWADHDRGHGGTRHDGFRHGGARVGVYLGAPVLGFPYYGYPGAYGYPYGYAQYGYYGPATTIITTPAAPPVYIEQGGTGAISGATGPASDGFYYYCSNPDGYYPYVKECPNGWQKVPPQPGSR